MFLRDSINRIPVQYKLALTFVSICLLAFGVGGYLVSGTARRSLENEILTRLEFHAQAHAIALRAGLDGLVQRSEDAASAHAIREGTRAALGSGDENRTGSPVFGLAPLLASLPLAQDSAVRGLEILSLNGERLASVGLPALADWPSISAPTSPLTATRVGGCAVSPGRDGSFRVAISTPILSWGGEDPLAYLTTWIAPGSWVRAALLSSDLGGDEEQETSLELLLEDPRGHLLLVDPLLTGRNGPSPDSDPVRAGMGLSLLAETQSVESALSDTPGAMPFVRSFELQPNGWTVHIKLDKQEFMGAVGSLQSRFLGVGIILTAIACVLLIFPLRFLARPLLQLTAAARKIKEGDYGVRVPVESGDELGQLSHTFNTMAEALGSHTHRLEQNAEDLRDRQRELGFERDRMEAVIASMHDGLIVLDGEGEPVVHNRAAEPIVRQLRDIETSLGPRHSCEAKNEGGKDCMACLFSPDSAPRSCVIELEGGVFEVHATHLRANGSEKAGRVLVSRDLTDRVNQDEQQIHQERLAVLGEVAAVMAHELNNPLAAMSMYNQMNATLSEGQTELLENTEVIQRNIQACKGTIRELLDYATGATPHMVSSAIHAVLEDTLTFLRPLARRSGVQIEIDKAQKEAYVMGDEVQIRQIFINLIVNGIQAIGPQGGEVRAQVEVKPDQVVVDIRDTGSGISADDRDGIFRPFFTTKVRGEGTGLGLPTSRRIAEMHGGGVELLSTSDQGTVFRVRLRSQLDPSE